MHGEGESLSKLGDSGFQSFGAAHGLYQTSTMSVVDAEIRASLERHNNIFESLLKLIPAKHYLVQDQNDEQVSTHSITFMRIDLHAEQEDLRCWVYVDSLEIPKA